MKNFILFGAFLFVVFALPAQNQLTKWYFGNCAALDFMTNPPTVLNNSAASFVRGSSSIADVAGNLLFYTDGATVWNSQHQLMANSPPPSSSLISYECMIIGHPNNLNLYYIFALGGNFNYSVVDMSLAAGLGSVTVINAPIYNGGVGYTQLHATKHANGVAYWVMVHEVNSNVFRAYEFNAAGVNTTAVTSAVGSTYGTSVGSSNAACSMKFSPNGQKLGTANSTFAELYDFDNTTGLVSNPLTLFVGTATVAPSNGGTNYYSEVFGCEFSPDNTKFYCSPKPGSDYQGYGTVGYIKQWDLSAGSNPAIISSSVNIYNLTGLTGGAMQLAPNGKIYITSFPDFSLNVINNPNAQGLACNYVQGGQNASAVVNYTNSGGSTYTINSRPYSYLPIMMVGVNLCTLSFTLQSSLVACAGAFAGNVSIANVGGSTGSLNYSWSNGSATYTSNALNNPSLGQWSLTVTDNVGCSATSVFSVSSPSVPVTPSISINSFSICAGDSIKLSASGANSYLWSNSANTPSILVSPSLTTQYYVTGIDVNGCTGNSAPVTVSVEPLPTLNISASNSFTLCSPQMQTLTVSGAYGYMWNWGATSWATAPNLVVNPAVTTQYTVTGNSQLGCKSVEVVTVTIGCVGVEELKIENEKLKIYPNPVSEIINVDISASLNVTEMKNGGKIEIYVYDILGKVILNKQLAINNGAAQINVSQIPKGIYFIKIETGNYPSVQRKFVKE